MSERQRLSVPDIEAQPLVELWSCRLCVVLNP